MKQVLALVAALFLLVRPLCDVQAAGMAQEPDLGAAHTMAGHGSKDPHGDTPCCAYLGEDAVAKLSEPAAPRIAADDGTPAIASAAWRIARHALVPEVLARASPRELFTPSSYYARSARIRR